MIGSIRIISEGAVGLLSALESIAAGEVTLPMSPGFQAPRVRRRGLRASRKKTSPILLKLLLRKQLLLKPSRIRLVGKETPPPQSSGPIKGCLEMNSHRIKQ